MKKILIIFFLSLTFCNISFAETYYFKKCVMDENFVGSFLINLDNKTIDRIFKNINKESVLEKTDKIKSSTRDQIVSEIIPSGAGTNRFFQYYLNASSKTVSIQRYKRDSLGLLAPEGSKQQNSCKSVKADWYQPEREKEIIEKKKQKEFEAEQERERLEEKKRKQEE